MVAERRRIGFRTSHKTYVFMKRHKLWKIRRRDSNRGTLMCTIWNILGTSFLRRMRSGRIRRNQMRGALRGVDALRVRPMRSRNKRFTWNYEIPKLHQIKKRQRCSRGGDETEFAESIPGSTFRIQIRKIFRIFGLLKFVEQTWRGSGVFAQPGACGSSGCLFTGPTAMMQSWRAPDVRAI